MIIIVLFTVYCIIRISIRKWAEKKCTSGKTTTVLIEL